MNKKEYVHAILTNQFENRPQHTTAEVFCPINIALIKYWGKRDQELMLPYNTSLSVTLKSFGTSTKLSVWDEDILILNSVEVEKKASSACKVFDFLHLICGDKTKFRVETENNIPIASGLASSASSFASFATAANELFGMGLSPEDLSRLARLGSVSAARSLHSGFVLLENDEDAHAIPLESKIEDLCIGFCIVSKEEKKYKSRDNMDYTVSNSVFYESWLQLVKRDLKEILPCIHQGDFYTIGTIAERNALCMHASIGMLNDIHRFYLKDESLAIIRRVQKARTEGLPVFCTVDAGPNVKLLFREVDAARVKMTFQEMSFYEKVI